MEAQYIDYDETRCFSSVVTRLLARDEKLKPFINQFPDLKSFENIIKERNFTGNRAQLVDVLKSQYQQVSISGFFQ